MRMAVLAVLYVLTYDYAYSRQQNHLHVWEFWIVHSIYILG